MANPVTMLARKAAVLLTIVMTMTSLSGCAQLTPVNCTAEAVADHFTLYVSSHTHPDYDLQLCTPESCTPAVTNHADETATTTGTHPRVDIYADTSTRWSVSIMEGRAPTSVEARVYTLGDLLTTRHLRLHWAAAHPDNPCSTWSTVPDVRITIP